MHISKSDERRHHKMKYSPNVFLTADKTTHMYELTPNEYKKLLQDNVTKPYKKVPTSLVPTEYQQSSLKQRKLLKILSNKIV